MIKPKNTKEVKNDANSFETVENSISVNPTTPNTNIVNKLGISDKPDTENNLIHFVKDK